jgi:hypothetical protein
MKDYIPRNPVMLNKFAKTLVEYVYTHMGAGPDAWNFPQARVAEVFKMEQDLVESIMAREKNPTPANRERVREAAKVLTGGIRAFVNQFLRFAPVTNADRIAMGIPNHDTIRTDHKVVTEEVEFEISPASERQLRVDFKIRGADHKAKPQGYDGAVIIWGLSDAEPPNYESLEHHIMASRTPFMLHFDLDEGGKTCSIAACWQNERGIRGAWTAPLKEAVVP